MKGSSVAVGQLDTEGRGVSHLMNAKVLSLIAGLDSCTCRGNQPLGQPPKPLSDTKSRWDDP